MARSLPFDLGTRLSQRAIAGAYTLPPKAQATLSAALDLGLRKNQTQRAIRELQQDPLLDVATLMRTIGATPSISPDLLREILESKDLSERMVNILSMLNINPYKQRGGNGEDEHLPEKAYTLLRDLMQICFPGMTGIAADAYARTDQMRSLARLVYYADEILSDDMPDVRVVLLAGWVQELKTQIGGLIDSEETYRRALEESGVEWKD